MDLCQLVPPLFLANCIVLPSWPLGLFLQCQNLKDGRQPHKTNITAKVPFCQFTPYNIYRSISYKSTAPCPNSCHFLTRQLQLPTGRAPSMLSALYTSNHPECSDSKCCKCKRLNGIMSESIEVKRRKARLKANKQTQAHKV